MDINFLRGIATVLAALAFVGVCVWAYGSKRKAGFDEAAQLPFADDELANKSEAEARKQ
jgi:cytochrome c oxidase cbb3-type subunit IV